MDDGGGDGVKQARVAFLPRRARHPGPTSILRDAGEIFSKIFLDFSCPSISYLLAGLLNKSHSRNVDTSLKLKLEVIQIMSRFVGVSRRVSGACSVRT